MTESAVLSHIAAKPGTHFNELVEALDLTPQELSSVSRHLERDNAIETADVYGKTHYYLPEYTDWEQGAIAMLRRETARDILCYLLAQERATPARVAEAVGIARSTLEWHLDRLEASDLVARDRDSWPTELTLTRPDEIGTLLVAIEPAHTSRWVDRTERLLDHLLEEL